MSYTKISNLFNVITQKSEYFQSYWAGYRHNVNENVVNNFNVDGNVGRLYPAVNWATPFGSSEDVSDDSNTRENIKISLYFDNLQGRDNCGNQTGLTLNEQIDELKEQARIFKETFKELCFDKYAIGVVNNSNIIIDINSDAHNDSLLVVRLDIDFKMYLDDCITIDTTDYPDELPECDLENYCDCAIDPSPVIPPIITDDLVLDLDAEKGVNSGTPSEDERVFLWSDQSGNNNDFVQTSGVFRPKFINNGINSMPSIYFDTSSFIERTDRLLSTNEATFMIVMERVGLPHIGNGAVAWLAGNSLLSFVQLRESAAQYQFNFNNSLTSDVTAVSNNKFMLSFVKRDPNADFYLSDTLVNTTTGTLSMAGTLYEIGKGTSNYFNGYVSRVLLYDRALTNLEIADNFINLKDKYNT